MSIVNVAFASTVRDDGLHTTVADVPQGFGVCVTVAVPVAVVVAVAVGVLVTVAVPTAAVTVTSPVWPLAAIAAPPQETSTAPKANGVFVTPAPRAVNETRAMKMLPAGRAPLNLPDA